MPLEPVQWSEKFSVGVRVVDQQHQQLIKLLAVDYPDCAHEVAKLVSMGKAWRLRDFGDCWHR